MTKHIRDNKTAQQDITLLADTLKANGATVKIDRRGNTHSVVAYFPKAPAFKVFDEEQAVFKFYWASAAVRKSFNKRGYSKLKGAVRCRNSAVPTFMRKADIQVSMVAFPTKPEFGVSALHVHFTAV